MPYMNDRLLEAVTMTWHRKFEKLTLEFECLESVMKIFSVIETKIDTLYDLTLHMKTSLFN